MSSQYNYCEFISIKLSIYLSNSLASKSVTMVYIKITKQVEEFLDECQEKMATDFPDDDIDVENNLIDYDALKKLMDLQKSEKYKHLHKLIKPSDIVYTIEAEYLK